MIPRASRTPVAQARFLPTSWLGTGAVISFTDGPRIPIRATLCWNFRETDNTTKISVFCVGARYKQTRKIQNTEIETL